VHYRSDEELPLEYDPDEVAARPHPLHLDEEELATINQARRARAGSRTRRRAVSEQSDHDSESDQDAALPQPLSLDEGELANISQARRAREGSRTRRRAVSEQGNMETIDEISRSREM
jgi:hypothetical protein